jgi:hypothetical protein
VSFQQQQKTPWFILYKRSDDYEVFVCLRLAARSMSSLSAALENHSSEHASRKRALMYVTRELASLGQHEPIISQENSETLSDFPRTR